MIDLLLDVDWPLEELWRSTLGFVAIVVTTLGVIGLGSGSMTIGALGAYTLFLYFAINVGDTLMTNVMYVSLALVCMGLGFKLIRLEGWGE